MKSQEWLDKKIAKIRVRARRDYWSGHWEARARCGLMRSDASGVEEIKDCVVISSREVACKNARARMVKRLTAKTKPKPVNEHKWQDC